MIMRTLAPLVPLSPSHPLPLLQYELHTGHQLVHSEYLQLLTALVHGLKLDSLLTFSPLIPIHLPPVLDHDWQWLHTFTATVAMAECFTKRCSLPWTPLVHHVDPSDKHHPLVIEY